MMLMSGGCQHVASDVLPDAIEFGVSRMGIDSLFGGAIMACC
jgi:hypothetical protein